MHIHMYIHIFMYICNVHVGAKHIAEDFRGLSSEVIKGHRGSQRVVTRWSAESQRLRM